MANTKETEIKIYLAAPFAARAVAVEVVDQLALAGHEVTSGWLLSTREITAETLGASEATSDTDVVDHAQGDFDDIDRADIVVMLTGEFCRQRLEPYRDTESTIQAFYSGGRHVEVGYAMGTAKAVHIVGEPENVFSRAFAFQHYTVDDLIGYLPLIHNTYFR